MPLYEDYSLASGGTPPVAPTVQPAVQAALGQPDTRPPEDVNWENIGTFDRLARSFQIGRLGVYKGLLGEQLREAPLGPSPELAAQLKSTSDRIKEFGGHGPGFLGWMGTVAEFAGQMEAQAAASTAKVQQRFMNPDPSKSPLEQAVLGVASLTQLFPPVGMATTNYEATIGNEYADLLEAKVAPQIASTAA